MSTSSSASSASKPSGGWQPPTLEEMQAMLPQYQFVSLLGRGGMGAVFKAVQVTLDRPVAIKVLPVDLVADDDDAQFAERFKNEARTMAKMNHPAIVNVYDFGETNTGLLYIVMEFIDGTDVAQMIASQGKLPEDYALSITAHVGDALQYAHTHGVIHRDIKPANILINMDGAVKVADFGLAKAHDAAEGGLTKTNMAMGTPDFVAPEALISGIPLDGRADLYAMGVMLYQMLTGEIPRGIWTMPSAKLGTDPRFDGIIAKAMQTDREVRYQSAAELRQDLDTILTLPRAVLVAQQQAAAEAAARAAQKQRQASSGPQKRPVSPPSQETPPPVKKKSSLVPLAGVVISVLLVAGVFQLLKKPEAGEGHAATAPPVEKAAARVSDTPNPPTATTVTAPAGTTQASGEGWVDGLAHIFADPKQSQKLSRQPDGSALVIASTDLWPMAIEGPPLTDQAVRMTGRFGESNFTLSLRRTETDPNVAGSSYELKWLPGNDKMAVGRAVPNRSVQGILEWKLPPGTDRNASHTLEFRAIGDQLTVSLDGRKIGELKNADVVQGFPHARFFKDAVIERLEYADLRGARADLTEPPATVVGKVPSMPAPPAPAAPTTAVKSTLQPGWTDLLAKADVARDTVQGRWEMKADGLHCVPSGGQQDYFKFDLSSSEEYDFEIDFTVLDGKIGSVSQMLVVPGHRFALVMNSNPFSIFLGAHLDGKGWKDPERTEAMTREFGIEKGRRMRSRVEIRRGTARVMIDDREVINWSGDFRRLNLHTQSYGQRHPTQLAIACQNAEVVFHQARLRPIAEAEKMLAKVPAPPSPALTPAPAVVKDAGPSHWKMRKQGRSGAFAVASSADGNRLVAAAPGSVHTSTDSGATWKSVPLAGKWGAVTSSADGTRLAVAGWESSIHTSIDSGLTWTECPSGVHRWSSLACSADGMKLVAVRNESGAGSIHISRDGGATWTEKGAGGDWWTSVASSADGTHLVAAGNGWAIGGYIFVSHDSGETWSKRMTEKPRRWSSVASSADGTRLAAADGGFINGNAGHLYTSADSGKTWVPTGPALPWNAVAISSSGHRLLAVAGRNIDKEQRPGEIYVSTDFGESWEAQETPHIWTSAASSADGTHLVAAGFSQSNANQIFTLDLRSSATRAGNDPRLLKLEAGFRARYEADVEKPYLTAVAALNKSYVNNGIAKARAAAQSRGSLQEVVAFDEVKARIERGEGVPDVDDPDAPESLKSLRAIYRGALAKITAERDAKAAPLYDIYIGALDAYLAELKNAEKLEEFQNVTTLRQEIAARRPRLADAPTVEKKPAVAATATAPAAPKPPSGVSSWRAAAEFLVKNGGSFLASKSGVQVMVTKEDEIPSGRFDILEINLDRGNSLLPPLKDADFDALKGLRDLRRASIIPSHPGLTSAAFAFLAGNDELLSLRVEGDPDFTSDKLAAVAGAKKLESIRIVNAPKFTGEGIDKLAGTGSIVSLDLLECGINDEGMRAIAACKKLQALFCNSAAVTPGGFAAIAGLKSLTTLGAYGTPLDDEAADSLSRLTNLTSLDLSNTRIGDAGLQKLSALKKLTSLNLGGTQVTLEAAAAFQKANPQCRVSR